MNKLVNLFIGLERIGVRKEVSNARYLEWRLWQIIFLLPFFGFSAYMLMETQNWAYFLVFAGAALATFVVGKIKKIY